MFLTKNEHKANIESSGVFAGVAEGTVLHAGGSWRGMGPDREGAQCWVKGVVAAVLLAACGMLAEAAVAGEAAVIDATLAQEAAGTWRVSATVRHADEGWEHYADRWEVLAPDGTVLATRVLLHPHVEEQPFTRSLSGVSIPDEIDRIIVRAHDNRHGYGGADVTIMVPGRATPP